MKNIKLASALFASIFSAQSIANQSCEDLGYNYHSSNHTVTSNWLGVVSTQSVNTVTDGLLTGANAVAYEYGLRDWNQAYKNQWCANKEASLTSSIPPYGTPAPVAGTFSCYWSNEPTTTTDVTSVINLKYCVTQGIRLR